MINCEFSLGGLLDLNSYMDFMQMCKGILMRCNAISGNSSQIPVVPIGGNEMYYVLWVQHAFIALAEQILTQYVRYP